MGIAKSTNIEESKPAEKKPFTQTSISGVPTVAWDIIRFFDINFDDIGRGSNEENLKDIESWTFKDVETAGEGLKKLKDLEITLGVPQNGESRITKIHRWIKLQRTIDDLRLRQRAL